MSLNAALRMLAAPKEDEGAVRKRTTRGTLRSERDAQGRVKDKAMDPNGYGR